MASHFQYFLFKKLVKQIKTVKFIQISNYFIIKNKQTFKLFNEKNKPNYS